jgi:hypothetical protein
MKTKVIHHGCGCSTIFILIIAICLLNTCSDLNKANAKNDALDQRVQKLEKKLKDAEWQMVICNGKPLGKRLIRGTRKSLLTRRPSKLH